GLALILRRFVERRPEFLELQMGILARLRFQRFSVVAIGILDLPPPLAVVGAEQVAKDREQPCWKVRAWLKRIDIGKRAEQGFLHEVVGPVTISAQGDRKS